MVKEELLQRSSVKALEGMAGNLAAGEAGLISSPSGLGKTSVLVQIALYKLLQEKKVVHISFTQEASYVLSWYEEILGEIIKNKHVANAKDMLDDIMKRRVLMNFNQDGVTSDTIRASLSALIKEGGFNAEAIIIDGFDFAKADSARVQQLKAFAKDAGCALWYSCTVKDQGGAQPYTKEGIPAVLGSIADDIDVIFAMEPKADYISLAMTKNRGQKVNSTVLKLDPKTLLLAE